VVVYTQSLERHGAGIFMDVFETVRLIYGSRRH